MKWILGILLVGIILFAGFIYVEFTGLPWKKYTIANELKEHIEKKYNIETTIQEQYYDFKYKGYGVRLSENGKDESFTFTAKKIREEITDSYAEHTWSWQINKDMKPIVEKHMTNIERHASYPVYGTGYHNNGTIPHYKEVAEAEYLHYLIILKVAQEDVIFTQLFRVIEEMKEKNIRNVEVSVGLENVSPDDKFTGLRIPGNALDNIKKKEDLLNYE